jgi:hypothetical protein
MWGYSIVKSQVSCLIGPQQFLREYQFRSISVVRLLNPDRPAEGNRPAFSYSVEKAGFILSVGVEPSRRRQHISEHFGTHRVVSRVEGPGAHSGLSRNQSLNGQLMDFPRAGRVGSNTDYKRRGTS